MVSTSLHLSTASLVVCGALLMAFPRMVYPFAPHPASSPPVCVHATFSARGTSGLYSTIPADTEDDAGPFYDDETLKKLRKMASNIRADGKPLTQRLGGHVARGALSRVNSWLGGNSNDYIFELFKRLRQGIPAQYIHLDEVDFSDTVRETLFWETTTSRNGNPLVDDHTIVGLLNGLMKYAPYMKAQEGLLDYDDLYGDKFLPYGRMMMADDSEDCFLRQAEAFCQKESSSSDRLICDLNYLSKYPMKKGTKDNLRYGGRAVVQGGKIVEIDGIPAYETNAEYLQHKATFLSSFAVHLVVVRHAVMTHLAISQRLLMKLTTKKYQNDRGQWEAYQKAWKSDEGAYLLLRALTTRTNLVSINEQLLIGPDRSLVGRAVNMTDLGLLELGSDMYNEFSSLSPDDLIANVANNATGSFSRAVNASWTAAQDCVNAICKNLVGDMVTQEDLANAALMLWVATFYHGFIGDFQLNNVNKGMLPFVLTGKPHVQDLTYGTLSTTIGVTTMTRTVNMVTLGGFFPEAWQKKAWTDYMATLANIDLGIKGFAYETPVYCAVNF